MRSERTARIDDCPEGRENIEDLNIEYMTRIQMIDTVSRELFIENLESGEFSYVKALGHPISGHYKLDIRFYEPESKTAVLIETKQRYVESDKEQLFDYVDLEKELNPQANIIAILANTANDRMLAWKAKAGRDLEILNDTKLKSMEEYVGYFKVRHNNDPSAVLTNTSQLNELLHANGIKEDIRSQFVGTCLLALKYGLVYQGLSNGQIRQGITDKLQGLMDEGDYARGAKITILCDNILGDETVLALDKEHFQKILDFIKTKIYTYINDESFEGQDLLSYFFTTFNKYVSREDKNQAFTPNHITHFMTKVGGINKNTRVLDPTCGSGTFLVQAMSQILKECETEAERNKVKKQQIYGIETAEKVFGLATTNMLIHSDGNSNIVKASCFDKKTWIKNANINLVLMNPPYNAVRNNVASQFPNGLGDKKEDPSKGLCFVKYIADTVNQGRLLALLPMQCAIATSSLLADMKNDILQHHTLDAVFSFPPEMFYPGASAVACCLVLKLGQPHPHNYKTFFGYFKDDGFEKRKGVGRIDVKNKWNDIEAEWLDLYEHRLEKVGKSVLKEITSGEEEWCAEAYMETDYSTLTEQDFINKLRDYAAFLVQNEGI